MRPSLNFKFENLVRSLFYFISRSQCYIYKRNEIHMNSLSLISFQAYFKIKKVYGMIGIGSFGTQNDCCNFRNLIYDACLVSFDQKHVFFTSIVVNLHFRSLSRSSTILNSNIKAYHYVISPIFCGFSFCTHYLKNWLVLSEKFLKKRINFFVMIRASVIADFFASK